MKRRACLKTILVGACAATAAAELTAHPIQLHVDLSVDPTKEQEMLHNFHNVFRPAATKQPGFIDVKMLGGSVANSVERPRLNRRDW